MFFQPIKFSNMVHGQTWNELYEHFMIKYTKLAKAKQKKKTAKV